MAAPKKVKSSVSSVPTTATEVKTEKVQMSLVKFMHQTNELLKQIENIPAQMEELQNFVRSSQADTTLGLEFFKEQIEEEKSKAIESHEIVLEELGAKISEKNAELNQVTIDNQAKLVAINAEHANKVKNLQIDQDLELKKLKAGYEARLINETDKVLESILDSRGLVTIGADDLAELKELREQGIKVNADAVKKAVAEATGPLHGRIASMEDAAKIKLETLAQMHELKTESMVKQIEQLNATIAGLQAQVKNADDRLIKALEATKPTVQPVAQGK